MTFEGCDAAMLIETSGFAAANAAGMPAMGGGDGSLEAALKLLAPAEEGGGGEIGTLDLWADRSGHHLSRSTILAAASWRGWLFQGEAESATASLDEHGGGKDFVLRAAFDDVDGDGKEDEPITVKGTRNVDGGTGDDTGGGYGAGFYPGTGDGGGTSFSSGPQKAADHPQDCGTDDGAAVQVAKHVMGTPPGAGPPNPLTSGGFDWHQVEFGAIIIRNPDGTYGALNDSIYSSGNTGFTELPIASGTNATGIWHNHTTRDGPGQQAIDRYPSASANGGGDWDALQQFHDEVAPNDPSFDPSMWITGPDGVTREFKLSERSQYENLTPEQMQAGEGLAGKERTQSCG